MIELLDWMQYVPTVLISIFAGVSRTLVQNSKRSIAFFLSSIVLAVFVGVMAYNVSKAYKIDPDMTLFLTGAAAFIADDLLLAIRAIGAQIRSNPMEALKLFLQKFTK